jgi:hypothetical protein
MKNLYYELKWADNINKHIADAVKDMHNILDTYKGLPGYHNRCMVIQRPTINTHEVQRSILKKYRHNTALVNAIRKKETVKDALERVAQENTGLKKIIPRKKDKEHNKEVESLECLVGDLEFLKCKGYHAPDNFFTLAAYTIGLGLAGGMLLHGLVFSGIPETISEFVTAAQHYFIRDFMFPGIIMGPALTLFVAPAAAYDKRFKDKPPYEKAEYIDETLKNIL